MSYAPEYYASGSGVTVAIGQLNAITRQVQVGEAVAPAQAGHRGANNKWMLSEADDTLAKAEVEGIFLTPADADGFAVVLTSGLVDLNVTLEKGAAYFLGTAPGAIVRESSLSSGDYPTFVGFAEDTQFLRFNALPSKVTKA